MTQDQDRRKGELIDFMAAAARRGKKPAESAPSVSIKGNGNIVGNHNQVRVTVHTRPATRVTVAPGPEHITPAQAADIRDLVDRLVKLQGHTHQKVWYALKRRFRFASYHLAPAAQFAEIHAYLVAWLAQSKAPATRETLLRRIHAQARKLPGGIDQVKLDNGIPSLKQLTDAQLHQLALKLTL